MFALHHCRVRRKRIFAELEGYNADIVCLQEVTPDTFEKDFKPFFKDRGLDRVRERESETDWIG